MAHPFRQVLLCTEREREHAWEMCISAPPLLQISALKIGERSSFGTGGSLAVRNPLLISHSGHSD